MGINFSLRIYRLLLKAYPYEFRREYGVQMLQVFRDCYRDETSGKKAFAIVNYWWKTLVDLVWSALKEHGESFGKDRRLMNNLRKDATALFGTIIIIVIAMALHRWIINAGRSDVVSSILPVGFALDAVVTAGIVGNLLVFLLIKVTKWDSLRIALWTFLIVHVTLLSTIAIIGPRIEPQFNFGPVLFGYVISFLFWFGLHWAWRILRPEVAES